MDALAPFLNELEIEERYWRLHGSNTSGTGWALIFKFSARENANKAKKVMDNLKGDDGEYKIFEAKRENGRTEQFTIKRDASGETTTRNRVAGAMQAAISKVAPAITEYGLHQQRDFRKNTHILFLGEFKSRDRVALCSFCPDDYKPTEKHFKWNYNQFQEVQNRISGIGNLEERKNRMLETTIQNLRNREEDINWRV